MVIGAYDEHWQYWLQVFFDAEDFKLWETIADYEDDYVQYYTQPLDYYE